MIADIFIVFKKYTLYKIHPQEYMPLPPGDEEEKSAEENSEPKFQFSYVECLISTFHQLAKKVKHVHNVCVATTAVIFVKISLY